ncbi:MAG: flagellum-specific ATP synthase [Nitriliruptoraceae bacterium]|jgi:flagellum-specific ATP synthase
MTDARLLNRVSYGAVTRVIGHEVQIRGLRLAVGDALEVSAPGGLRTAEVISVDEHGAHALLLAETTGIASGARVRRAPVGARVPVGNALLGRVINALGEPIDGGPPIQLPTVSVHNTPPPALSRRRVDTPLPVGVRVLDVLCTAGAGQRIGIFAGSGVGKSTLLGMMVRGTTAPVRVVAMIGERGREVREFVEDELGPEGLAQSVVVVATSDEPPLLRLRAGFTATRIAEWFADAGNDVLLTLDSLTRLAHAQRDVGLAAGEPPTARGYTPSVFALLPRLLERAGPRANGSITAFYTVLVDGDDMNDPIADAARSILDGHVVLDRSIAERNHWPAVDALKSLSRLASKLHTPEQAAIAARLRAGMAAAAEVRDLVEVGAYVAGTNSAADEGLALAAGTSELLQQTPHDLTPYDEAWSRASAVTAPLASDAGPGQVTNYGA